MSEELIAPTSAISIFRIEDCMITMYKPGPTGGMQTGKMPTGVHALHIPTGIAVVVDGERSMHRNKKLAIEALEGLINGNRTEDR